MEPVTTPRLVVCLMAHADLPDLMAYHAHPDIARALHAEPMTEERARRFLERQAEMQAGDQSGCLAFAVEHRGDG